jgi:hypothetical protein
LPPYDTSLIPRRGLHQSGYVIWFTALFPYFVMITLLIKALTLEGAMEGLKAYVHVSTVRAVRCVVMAHKCSTICRGNFYFKMGDNTVVDSIPTGYGLNVS